MIQDGATYQQIIAALGASGEGLNDQNLTAWKEGGHQDWLKDMDRIEGIRARSNASLEMVRELKKDGEVHITEANDLILASQINEVLSDFDTDTLKGLMQEKPATFLRLAMAVTSQTGERTKREKLELEVKKYQAKIAEAQAQIKKLRDPQESLSETERKAIVDKVDEILGVK